MIIRSLSILIAMVLLFCNAAAVSAKESKTKFAFVFNSSRNPDAHSFSLYGHHALNKRVYLLSIERNHVCEAVTTKHKEFTDDIVGFPITILKPSPHCNSPKGYSVAIFQKSTDYRMVSLGTIVDGNLINSLDILVRKSPVSIDMRLKAQGAIPGDEDYSLDYFFAKVFRFNIDGAEGYIVSYEKGDEYGPRFVVFGKSVHPLTGWCSYPYLRAFILNDKFYIESGSGCCECGITVMELYKIERNKVILILDDGSESD